MKLYLKYKHLFLILLLRLTISRLYVGLRLYQKSRKYYNTEVCVCNMFIFSLSPSQMIPRLLCILKTMEVNFFLPCCVVTDIPSAGFKLGNILDVALCWFVGVRVYMLCACVCVCVCVHVCGDGGRGVQCMGACGCLHVSVC